MTFPQVRVARERGWTEAPGLGEGTNLARPTAESLRFCSRTLGPLGRGAFDLDAVALDIIAAAVGYRLGDMEKPVRLSKYCGSQGELGIFKSDANLNASFANR